MNGINGISAYEVWLNLGNNGTEADFISSLTGPQGPTGVNGSDGANGVNGINTLINTITEPAGANCTNGGTKIEVGLDTNNNNVLDNEEINNSSTKFICNGVNNNLLINHGIYSYTTSSEFIVPSGVNLLYFDFYGTSGGRGETIYVRNNPYNNCGTTGVGNGGSGGANINVKGQIYVNEGDILNFDIGINGSGRDVNFLPCNFDGEYLGLNGFDGSVSSIRLNNNIILTLIGGKGGIGSYKPNMTQVCVNGINGVNGQATYLETDPIVLFSTNLDSNFTSKITVKY